jgi:hypothetical protein
MTPELIVSLVALLTLLAGAFLGWKNGGAAVLRWALVIFFATLAALRFWHLTFAFVAKFLPGVPQGFLASAILIALFIIAGGLAGAVVDLKVAGFQSVYTSIPDNVIGLVFGLFSSALLGGMLLIVAALILPGLGQSYDTKKLTARVDEFPVAVFQVLESNIAGVPDVSPSRTPMPAWQGAAEDGKLIWQ